MIDICQWSRVHPGYEQTLPPAGWTVELPDPPTQLTRLPREDNQTRPVCTSGQTPHTFQVLLKLMVWGWSDGSRVGDLWGTRSTQNQNSQMWRVQSDTLCASLMTQMGCYKAAQRLFSTQKNKNKLFFYHYTWWFEDDLQQAHASACSFVGIPVLPSFCDVWVRVRGDLWPLEKMTSLNRSCYPATACRHQRERRWF